MKFDTSKLKPGDILAGRNEMSTYGKAIRATLGCWSNHNGIFIRDENMGWCIGEAVKPCSRLSSLAEYEKLMTDEAYKVRVWRVRQAKHDSREFAAYYFRTHLLGMKYANFTIARLGLFRLVNNIPWKLHIHGVWCTELVKMAWHQTTSEPFKRPDGSDKKNPTPRTTENRLVSGVLEDVTASCITL